MLDFHVTVDPNISRLFYAQPADTNHVLTAIKDVQQFYQDSFANLLWVMGIIISVGFLLVGVVMPLVLQRLQSRSFKKTEQNLLGKFQNDIEAAKAALKSETDSKVATIKTQLSQTGEQLKQEAKENFIKVTGDILLSHATTLSLTSSNTSLIISLSLRAAHGFATLQNDIRLDSAIDSAEKCSPNLRQHLISKPLRARKEWVNELLKNCNLLLDKLKEKNLDTKYLKRVFAIEDIIRNIPLESKVP